MMMEQSAESCNPVAEAGGVESVEMEEEGRVEDSRCMSGAPVKKSRRNSVRKPRTKGLVKKLQEQIEFYFGDANLSKDRFLHQKIKEGQDGYVAVDVIADFKKMNTLTLDKTLIIKAIQNSSLVELSPDGHSLRRCHPLPTVSQEQVDERTIYVEKIPAQVHDHESVSKMFREFGEVCYVSLPKFKRSGVIKGFAFIEFTTKEAAHKAIEYFKVKDSLPPDMKKHKPSKVLHALSKDEQEKIGEEMDTEELEDDTFVSEEEETEQEPRDAGKAENGVEAAASLEEAELPSDSGECKALKRSRTEDHDSSGDESAKRKKDKDEAASCNEALGRKETDVSGEERGETDVCEAASESNDGQSEDNSVRKRTREEEVEGDVGGQDVQEDLLKVSAEKRHKLSGDESSALKEFLQEARQRSEGHKVDTTSDGEKMDEDGGQQRQEDSKEGGKEARRKERSTRKKRNRTQRKKPWGLALRDMDLRVMTKLEWLEMKSMFKSMQKENFKKLKAMTSKGKGDGKKPAKPDKAFVKNCLVKVALEKECEEHTKDMLKELCEKFGEVAFVDINEGDTKGYVRFKSSGCVEGLVQSESVMEGISLQSVNEEDEREYFLKTIAERKQKYKVNKKKMNQRGKDKLISKVLKAVPSAGSSADITSSSTSDTPHPTHIMFPDSDNSDIEAE